ncbi:hypothetical protein CO180_01435 [candidate division WWE3 bacterium CG_4_9_14_3_um_filter_41_6]|uniref:Histidine phosphatase family protein n=1 Tax=candidate division WWE3 bacterium CG_4_10_14_0_2_um_filter_41_14 TaxID=1975072 RepID=A0A2M7TKP7_UNCKA|nr:MAG: hypothetical protein COY32_01835 [candidate division WWE3 bacterium CG_4_10_14_0_2_um_filter_41_14]PJA39154.1 MAG: hypothetical protein CO180_01435 [candidate division WWE3 bacterium CG_4_9_14_3_um_filter_41_6]
MTIYLVRHGDTGVNEQQQQADTPLSPKGEAVVRATVSLRTNMNAIGRRTKSTLLSSTLVRARQTAHIIADEFEIPLQFDPRLNEIDIWLHGNDQEITQEEIMAKVTVTSDKLTSLVTEYFSKDTTLVLVTHGNIIRTFLMFVGGMSLSQVLATEIPHISVTSLSIIKSPSGEIGATIQKIAASW